MPTPKAELRALIRARRGARTDAERAAAGDALARLGRRIEATCVAAFVGTGTEPPTLALLDALAERGIRVLLPLLREDWDLEWAAYEGRERLRRGRLGLLEPTAGSLGLDGIAEADLVLAPALAVDQAGGRLGQGGGSFDRALTRVEAPVIAVVYDDEIVDEVPMENHDRRVDGVLTPAHPGIVWADR